MERPHGEATWRVRGPDTTQRKKRSPVIPASQLHPAPVNLSSKCSPSLVNARTAEELPSLALTRLQTLKQLNGCYFKPLSFGFICFTATFNCNKLNIRIKRNKELFHRINFMQRQVTISNRQIQENSNRIKRIQRNSHHQLPFTIHDNFPSAIFFGSKTFSSEKIFFCCC